MNEFAQIAEKLKLNYFVVRRANPNRSLSAVLIIHTQKSSIFDQGVRSKVSDSVIIGNKLV